MTPPDVASVGRVRRPHGLKGELVVEALTDEPDAIFAPGRRVFRGTASGDLYLAPGSKQPAELTVTALRPFKEGWLVSFAEIADRTEADKWNGRHLLVPLEELSEPEEGEVFAHELVGMTLVDAATGKEIGPVVEFYDLPQGLLLEFKSESGLANLPFVDEFVTAIDREARRITVTLPDGLLS